MVLGNLSHAERLGHNVLFYSLSNVTTQKWLIYHQKREKSEKCPIILLERERERERERETQGVGRDMSCPRKLFLDERKSVFRDVRMQSCLALRLLVTLRPPLHEIFAFLSNVRPRLACMRTSQKTDFG